MILFTALLALSQLFIISQFWFWGASPVLLALVVYIFRYEAKSLEMLAAASVYGFVLSVFSDRSDSLVVFLSAILATGFTMLVLTLLYGSRLRTRLRAFDAALVAGLFTSAYWLVLGAPYFGKMRVPHILLFVVSSALSNLILMLASDIGFRKLTGRYGS